MIISHAHRFIFIKTNKTAGTSIEIALSRHCGPEDVITPISPDDERLRAEAGGRGPQNHQLPWREHGPVELARALVRGRRRARYFNHIGADRVREFVGAGIWDDYFTFCVERNPWDRVLSQYRYRHPQPPRPTLREFIASPTVRLLRERGSGAYRIDGRIAVDRVCRYEDLAAELEAVRTRIGLPEPLRLPRAKAAGAGGPGRDLYGPEERDAVAELFAEEIEAFGYRF